LGYTDSKEAKYLFDLPKELRTQIYDAQSIISAFYKGTTAGLPSGFRSVVAQLSAEIKTLKSF
jgi:hypothetical protein